MSHGDIIFALTSWTGAMTRYTKPVCILQRGRLQSGDNKGDGETMMVAGVRVREVHGFLHGFKARLLGLVWVHAGHNAGPLPQTVPVSQAHPVAQAPILQPKWNKSVLVVVPPKKGFLLALMTSKSGMTSCAVGHNETQRQGRCGVATQPALTPRCLERECKESDDSA